jgi:hypothetical protein
MDRTMTMTRLAPLAAAVAFAAVAVDADALVAQRHQLTLEATPVHGTIGFGWAVGAHRFAGIELGIGVPQIDRTLLPDEPLDVDGKPTFLNLAHIGGFLRFTPASLLAADLRAMAGIAALDGCSDCLPGGYLGAGAGACIGWRNVRFGSRVIGGVIKEGSRPSRGFVNFTPFAILLLVEW